MYILIDITANRNLMKKSAEHNINCLLNWIFDLGHLICRCALITLCWGCVIMISSGITLRSHSWHIKRLGNTSESSSWQHWGNSYLDILWAEARGGLWSPDDPVGAVCYLVHGGPAVYVWLVFPGGEVHVDWRPGRLYTALQVVTVTLAPDFLEPHYLALSTASLSLSRADNCHLSHFPILSLGPPPHRRTKLGLCRSLDNANWKDNWKHGQWRDNAITRSYLIWFGCSTLAC